MGWSGDHLSDQLTPQIVHEADAGWENAYGRIRAFALADGRKLDEAISSAGGISEILTRNSRVVILFLCSDPFDYR